MAAAAGAPGQHLDRASRPASRRRPRRGRPRRSRPSTRRCAKPTRVVPAQHAARRGRCVGLPRRGTRASQRVVRAGSTVHRSGVDVRARQPQLRRAARRARGSPGSAPSPARRARRRAAGAPRPGPGSAAAARARRTSRGRRRAPRRAAARRAQRQHGVRPAGEPGVGAQQPAADVAVSLGAPARAPPSPRARARRPWTAGDQPGQGDLVPAATSTSPSRVVDHGDVDRPGEQVADHVGEARRDPSGPRSTMRAHGDPTAHPTRLQHERHTRSPAADFRSAAGGAQ